MEARVELVGDGPNAEVAAASRRLRGCAAAGQWKRRPAVIGVYTPMHWSLWLFINSIRHALEAQLPVSLV